MKRKQPVVWGRWDGDSARGASQRWDRSLAQGRVLDRPTACLRVTGLRFPGHRITDEFYVFFFEFVCLRFFVKQTTSNVGQMCPRRVGHEGRDRALSGPHVPGTMLFWDGKVE